MMTTAPNVRQDIVDTLLMGNELKTSLENRQQDLWKEWDYLIDNPQDKGTKSKSNFHIEAIKVIERGLK